MSLKSSILVALLVVAAPHSAQAEDVKRECVDASTLGQTDRNGGQLLEARAQFLLCAREACPAPVRDSCNRWLAEVEELTPSVVVHASDATGSDLVEGVTSIDGVSYPLDGKTISLDPGKHVVLVERDGVKAEKKVLLSTGEKSRLIELRLDIGKPTTDQSVTATPSPALAVTPPQNEAAHADHQASIPTGAWVLGGASLVAFGSFAFFAVGAHSEYDKLKAACSPSCTDEQMKTGRTNALAADISLGVGVAALAGGITWALLAKHSAHPTTARLSVAPTPGGGYASFSSAF